MFNPDTKLQSNIFEKDKVEMVTTKDAQEIQDAIFRAMTIEQKLKMARDFFEFARKANPDYFSNVTRDLIAKIKSNP